tara:strand:+ start:7394 stop:8038 length:645 start_codon:yes stop_codon:yes gene_type:complete
MDFFISDIHFGHKNVIRFCNRPFVTVSEMNNEIISRWNSVVTDADRVFVVGDVFLCSPEEAKQYISQLNGHKILVQGNHDLHEKKMLWTGFDEFHKRYEYTMPDGRLALIEHYPSPDCLLDCKYDLMIHGHIHIDDKVVGKKINVSCDIWDFYPVSIDKLCELKINDLEKEEFFKVNVDENGVLSISCKIRMEDFSGAAAHVYKEMNRKHRSQK